MKKEFTLKIFEAFSIERWNDLVRPFEIIEMDKHAEKTVVAYIIAKYEENRDRKFHKIPEQGSKEKLVWLGGDAKKIVEEKGLVQISDAGALVPMITEILDNNEQSIEDFKNGKDRAIGFLVGQIMKQTRGKANPKMVNKLLNQELQSR